MGAFINLPADPTLYNMLEARVLYDVTLEDTLKRTCVAVFHYRRVSGSTPPNLAGIADALASTVGDRFSNALNVRVTNIRVDVRPLDDPLSIPVPQSGGPSAGVVSGEPQSIVNAAVIDLNTGVRGRSFRGRKHISGLSESDSTGGDELTGTALVHFASMIAQILANPNDGAGNIFTPCVLSPTLSDILGTPPTFTGADIIGGTCSPIIGTMRKRKERVPS